MKSTLWAALATLVLAHAVSAQSAPVLVSTDWLAEHLNDDKLVLLHIGNANNYAEAHIPGARLIQLAAYAPERNGLSTELPEPDALKEVLQAAGVSNDSRIIVYSTAHPPQLAARLYVTLDHFGLGAQTSLLDGGLRAWRAENRAVTTEATVAQRGNVDLRPRDDLIVDHTYVQQRLTDPTITVVDARDTPFWTGAQQNQQRAARPGRVPGARNVPFNTLVEDSGRLLGLDALKALFTRAGVADSQPLVVYCHVGQQASLLFLAAKVMGYPVRLYDGSYEDWSKRTELQVQTGG